MLDYLYDRKRRSWIACYPSRAFVELMARENRGRIAATSSSDRPLSRQAANLIAATLLIVAILPLVYFFVAMYSRLGPV
jgi:hypothetical protein